MTSATWRRVKEVYSAASDLPAAERDTYLDRIAREHPRIASEARRLLRLDRGAEEQLASLRVPSGLLAAAAERRTFFDGERLDGRYQIRRYLASGGMGEVYEADDFERGERIAIKVIRPELAEDTHLTWLQREVDHSRRIQHPNVCRVYDLIRNEGRVFLTMEMLPGETLAAYLRRHGALSERQALPLIRQIVAGLHAAHSAGVIHRDLKPANIMIVPRAEGASRVVLMDFGLARHSPPTDATGHSQTWSIGIGTPAYMAPEQIEGRKSTAASDIYSLGVVLFEMLTGHLPFPNDSPLSLAVRKTREDSPSVHTFVPNLRASWAAVLRRCLDPRPGRRFASVVEVLPALESRSPARYWRRRASRWFTLRRNLVRLGLVAALSGLVLWFLVPRPPSAEALALWEQGIQSLHAGAPAVAVGYFEQSLATGRPPARLPADQALAWQALDVPAQAKAALARSPRWFHSDPEYLRAVTLYLENQRERALAALPEQAGRVSRLADLAYLGQGPPARWRRVAQLRPDYAPAHLHLAEAAAAEGRWREADGEFQAALLAFETARNRAGARFVAARRGLRRLEAGDAPQALADLSANPSAPPGNATCEHVTVLWAGLADNFGPTPDPPPYISANFAGVSRVVVDGPRRGFDELLGNQELAFSIPLPPVRICAAKVEFRIRRGPEPTGPDNDEIMLGAAPFSNAFNPPTRIMLWNSSFGASERVSNFDLPPDLFANIQRAYAGQAQASLDVVAGDDTLFDYFKLTIFY